MAKTCSKCGAEKADKAFQAGKSKCRRCYSDEKAVKVAEKYAAQHGDKRYCSSCGQYRAAEGFVRLSRIRMCCAVCNAGRERRNQELRV